MRVGTVLAAGAAVAMMAACGGRPVEPATAAERSPISVSVARVSTAVIGDTFEAGGLVEARTTAAITARIVAPIREMRVKAGDRVRQGQVLVVLDGADLDARSRSASAAAVAASQDIDAAANGQREADAALTLARTTRTRIDQLFARKSATQQELDNAEAALRVAEARAQGAASRLAAARAGADSASASRDAASATAAFATITAPFDGVISATMAESGNMAAPGQPLLRLEDTRALLLAVRVDESRLNAVKPGQRIPITLDGGADRVPISLDGEIVEVGRLDDASAHAYLVKIALPPASSVEPGRFGRARFTTGTRHGVVLPDGALRQQGQLASVFVVDYNVARLRMVDMRGGEAVAGVVAGDLVVVRPPVELTDGRRVVAGGGK